MPVHPYRENMGKKLSAVAAVSSGEKQFSRLLSITLHYSIIYRGYWLNIKCSIKWQATLLIKTL
jgi:hypothetical protein